MHTISKKWLSSQPWARLNLADMVPNKLDDGWPESVEEQSLLLLVWRHYITR